MTLLLKLQQLPKQLAKQSWVVFKAVPTFLFEGQPINFEDGETVLEALTRSGTKVENGCRAGACQKCLLRAENGVPSSAQTSLDQSIVDAGGFLSCQLKASDAIVATRFDDSFFPSFPAVLVGKTMLTSDVCKLSLEVNGFGFFPGRFIQLNHKSGIQRPYSIASSAFDNSGLVDLHVRLIPNGSMSQAIKDSELGDEFLIKGPFGKCFYRENYNERPIVLIGSGTGLAPLYGILCDALSRGHKLPISLYHGSAHAKGLYFQSELFKLGEEFVNFTYVACADEPAADTVHLGSPLDVALSTCGDLTDYIVYLCGHPALVKTAQKRCFLAGASLKEIFADPFEPSR